MKKASAQTLLLLLIFLSIQAFSQTHPLLDSLQQELKNSEPDSTRGNPKISFRRTHS